MDQMMSGECGEWAYRLHPPRSGRAGDRWLGQVCVLQMTIVVTRARVLNQGASDKILGCHFPAALRAATAGLDAFLHVANALTVIRTFAADLGAFATGMLVVLGTDEHEMRRCPADLGACHHQREVPLFGVLAAQFQAVAHGGRKAHGITAHAFVDAAFHFGAKVMHGRCSLFESRSGLRRLLTITLRWHQATA